MKVRTFIWLMLTFSVTSNSIAQDDFTMEKYLATALKDQSLELFQAQASFLEDNNYNFPWINRVDVRIGSDRTDRSVEEFRLRLSPSNPAEVKANKEYHDKHQKSIATNYQIALNDALKNRYELLLQYHYFTTLLARLEQNLVDLTSLNQTLSSTNIEKINAGDIIEIQENQSALMLRIDELKYQKEQVEYFIALDMPDSSPSMNESLLISIDQIRSYLQSRESHTAAMNLSIKEAEDDLMLSEQMLRIEKAEAWSNIGFIQGVYDIGRGNEINEHIGFQIGVRLPIVNPDKPKIQREQIELLEDEMELSATKDVVSKKRDLLILRLTHLLNQSETLNERIKMANDVAPQNSSGLDLAQLLKIKKYKNKLSEQRLSLDKNLREAFIDYLDLSGYLIEKPLVNYLSSDFSKIEKN